MHEQQESASQAQPQPRGPAAAVSPGPPVCEPEKQQGHTEREVLKSGQVVPGEAAQHADQRPTPVGGSRGAKEHVHADGQEQQWQDRQDSERAHRPEQVHQGDASEIGHDAGGGPPLDDQPAWHLSPERTIEEHVPRQMVDDILVGEMPNCERNRDIGQDSRGQQPLFQGRPSRAYDSCHVGCSSSLHRGRGYVFGSEGAGWRRSEVLPASVRLERRRRKGPSPAPVSGPAADCRR